jgi:DNA repair photolyase
MKLIVINVPSINDPIKKSPGFAKKELADAKLDLMALCGFGCSYCSSNTGNYLRINRHKFADLTEAQIGQRLYPADSPGLTFVWPDVLERLAKQLSSKPKDGSWGRGQTLVVSQLTDAFSPLALVPIDGGACLTERALLMVLERTSFRIRILTKSAVVGTEKWIEFFKRYPGRFVVGLSIGTLDDEWARRVEIGTSSPSARLRAHRALQDAGVPTFGMLCPVFPDALASDGVERLMEALRPELCETVWGEPYNDRDNWRVVRAGYAEGSSGWNWLTSVYEKRNKALWSSYAAELYDRLSLVAVRGGWLGALRYLMYEGDIVGDADADAFVHQETGVFPSVLLQDKPDDNGFSRNPRIALRQHWPGQGYVGWQS